MEDTLQKVFSILLSVLIFFLLPLYMAFEKKDDIAYSLALKITSNFVDEVCNKGYMTLDMYNDYVSKLALTDNAYDISMEHTAMVYEPVIYGTAPNGTQASFDYNLYKRVINSGENTLTVNGVKYSNISLSYKVNEYKYYDTQMVRIMEQKVIDQNSVLDKVSYKYNSSNNKYENISSAINKYSSINTSNIHPISGLYKTSSGKSIYPMNVGDKFTVVIKNTNTTIASMLFNTLTFGAKTGANTKVYINYGGSVKNEQYRQTVIDSGVTSSASDYISLEEQNIDEIYSDSQNSKFDRLDFNGNVSFTKDDVELFKSALEESGNKTENMDLNSDGTVDGNDYSILVQIITKMFDFNEDEKLDKNDLELLNNAVNGVNVTINKNWDINSDGNKNKTDYDIISAIVYSVLGDNSVKVTSISLTGEDKVNVGDSIQLTAKITPEIISSDSLSWKSSDPSIASVEGGKVTAKKTGKVKITASATDGSGKSATKEIQVIQYLYNKGKTYGITGGINVNAGYAFSKDGHATDNSNQGYITISNPGNGYRTYIATKNQIDWTNYSKVYVELEVDAQSGNENKNSTWATISSLGNFNNVEVNDTDNQKIHAQANFYGGGRTTLVLNVSNVSNKSYLTVSFAHKGTLRVYSIWAE